MIRGTLTIVAWLCAGHAVAAALFYGLVNTPDSNVGMLVASALLVVAVLFVVGVTNVTAVQWLHPEGRFRRALMAGLVRGLPAALLACGVYALAWYAVGGLGEWYLARTGELDAWWIATFDSANTTVVHRTIGAMLFALRDIIGVTLAVGLFCGVALRGASGLAPGGWLRAAFSRTQLGMVALAVVLLILLPWRAAGWRPTGLPASTVELGFVIVKLGTIYVMSHLGWTLILAAATRAAAVSEMRRRWDA